MEVGKGRAVSSEGPVLGALSICKSPNAFVNTACSADLWDALSGARQPQCK